MKLLSGILLFLCLAIQFSCDKGTEKQSQSESSSDTLSDSELERNRNLWRESRIENYRMTIDIDKTGHAAPNGKFVITVRNGRTESMKPADNPDSVTVINKLGNYGTPDDIFKYIENEEKSGGSWNRKEIQYDSKLGYPKKVDMDKANVNDEELFFQVLQFEVLQ